MASLAELYAKDLGVKIGEAVLDPHFYPLDCDKYITIHTSDKVPAKNYSYWNSVVKILKKSLGEIKIIQIGTQADPMIEGVDRFINNTTFNQTFFIIKHALCHVGIDSCPVHISSVFNTPTVAVYGHTFASTCDAKWVKSKTRHIVLEPQRENGECPSFSLNEHPKSVDAIPPERVANAVFKQLGLEKAKSEKTLNIGRKFLHKTIDIIPSKPCPLPRLNDGIVRVRMDLVFDEGNLANILQNSDNSFHIITQQPISTQILETFKPRVGKIIYETDEFDESFLKYLKNANVSFELNSLSEEKMMEQRSKFFNFDIALKEPPEIKHSIKKLIRKKGDKIKIDTSKIYLVGTEKAVILSNDYEKDDFWLDAEYFRFYINTNLN